jgi:DNA-binding FadR family transcriptional regulator
VTDLFALRQMVEPQAAALAAQSCAEATLSDIETAYADMVRYQNGSDDLIDADLRSIRQSSRRRGTISSAHSEV